MGIAVTILLNLAAARKAGYALETFLFNFNFHVAISAVAVFVWFKYHCKAGGKFYKLFRVLAKYSFGVYLVHPFLLIMLEMVGLNTMSFHPMVSVPLIWAIVTVISFGLSAIMNRIPVFNRYFV